MKLMKVEMSPFEYAEYKHYLDYVNSKNSVDPAWIALQKEITTYCHDHQTTNRSFSTQQLFIYSAIKFVTGVSRVDSLTGSQVQVASVLFHDLADKRHLFSVES